jgi:hypothetical protein
VHHRTIQINHQPDVKIFQFIILTFVYSSTCFGRFPAHHKELNDCSGSLWFYLRIVVTAVLCSWSGRPTGPTTNTARLSLLNMSVTLVPCMNMLIYDRQQVQVTSLLLLAWVLVFSVIFFHCALSSHCFLHPHYLQIFFNACNPSLPWSPSSSRTYRFSL